MSSLQFFINQSRSEPSRASTGAISAINDTLARMFYVNDSGNASTNAGILNEAIAAAAEVSGRVQICSEEFEFSDPLLIYSPVEVCGLSAPSGKWNTLKPLGTKLVWSGDDDYAIEWGATADSPQVLGSNKAVSGASMRDLVILPKSGSTVNTALLMDGSTTRYASRAALTDARLFNVSIQGAWGGHCLEVMGNVFDARFYDFGARGSTGDVIQYTRAESEGVDRPGQISFYSPVILGDEDAGNWAVDLDGEDGGYTAFYGGNIQGGKCLLAGYDTHVYGTHFECNSGAEAGKVGVLLKGRGCIIMPASFGGWGTGLQIGETDDELPVDAYFVVIPMISNCTTGIHVTGGTVGSRRGYVRVGAQSLVTTLVNNEGSKGEFQFETTLARKAGSTAQRPASTLLEQGFQYFDTTLGQPIYWDGDSWVDATGADPDA